MHFSILYKHDMADAAAPLEQNKAAARMSWKMLLNCY
jgi:hypothetical protein